MHRISIIFLLSLVLTTQSSGQYHLEDFGALDSEEGLSSSVITCMMKDSRGFIWFGTQDGLNRYDGYTFTVYKENDTLPGSISGNYILSLFEDDDGFIWVGTENNGLNRYNRSADKFTVFRAVPGKKDALPDNSIRDVDQTSDGTLLFGTDHGVVIQNPGKNYFEPLPLSGKENITSNMAVSDILIDVDKSIWIGTQGGLFHYLPDEDEIEAYFSNPDDENTLSNNVINAIYRSSLGTLYIGTNQGLNIFNPASNSFTRYYYDETDPYSEAKSEIQAIAEDQRGNLWLGSFGGGLIKINEETDQSAIFLNSPDNKTSISNDYVYTLLYDPAGILWIGTYGGGINKIDQVRIRFDFLEALPNDTNSLSSNDVYSILPMENEVWFGTENGIDIWNRQTNSIDRTMAGKISDALNNQSIYCMLEDHNKNTWVGTAYNGLFKINNGNKSKATTSIEHYTSRGDAGKKISSDDILCLHEDKDNNLWVGSLNGITVINEEQVVAVFQNDPADEASLGDNEVFSIFSDDEGTVWVGTFLGLNKFVDADSTFISYDNLLGTEETVNSIYCIYQDHEGYLWIGTDNSGLIKFDPTAEKLITRYTQNDNLPDNVIYGIIEDEENNLWLSSNNGLIKAIRQSGSTNLTFIHYNSDNWLKTNAYNIGASARGHDGILYFGSVEGVTFFHPDNVKGNNYVPPVHITDFQLFFEPVKISSDNSTPLSSSITETSTIRLSYKQNVIKFTFAALNFIQPENNSYAFWMENLEEQWNYVDNLREAQYMYIPPGDYIFHVKAANNDGVWNETGTTIQITIVPPFTQTVWFYVILLVIATAAVLWIFNFRTRNLRAQRARLEKQVQIRTQELRDTNRNLEDEIKERQKVQDALAKSEARFRQLIETMNEGFSVQDRKGRINYVNPKLCEMFGMEQEEIIGKFPIDFIDDSRPEYRKKFIEGLKAAAKEGIFYSYEMNWKRKDGSTFIAMVSPKPILDQDDTTTGSVAVLTDITDLKNVEKQLLTKNQDLNEALDDLRKTQAQLIDSEKMASLGQLTAGVAHEINNPINFVSGNVLPLRRDIKDILEVLEKYDQITESLKLGKDFQEVEALKKEIDFDFVLTEIDNLLNGIGEGASRTAEIVKGLRNFSRMDEHELKLANINQGIDSTLLILHNKIKNRIEIIKDYGDFPDVMCHPGQLNQVFMNLLNNAQEAIKGEGKIWIKTRKEKDRVIISIRDSGKGIPAKSKKKIFDPFFTTKDVGKGTGLGLSISFGIVEKHNGSITVNSESGKGSEFIVTIPDNLI